MGDWLLMPAKVFLIGLFLAIIATFSFRSVEIPYVQQAAIVSAQTASTSSTPQATATSTVDSMTHSSANDMLTIGNNGMVTSTVSYQPPNVFSNVFNYLGVPTPNQPIVMSSSAVAKNTGIQMQSVMPNLQLYTVSGAPTVANVVSGYEEEIIGTLAFAGTPIADADITLTTSGGTIGEATANPTNGTTTTIDGGSITLTAPSTSEVTTGIPSTTTLNLKTNAEGQFALDYYAPINIGQFSVTANGANATETVPISSTPVVTVGTIANTYVNGSTTISGNVETSSGSPVQDEPVTLTITAPDTTTQQVNTTTNSSGDFSATYTPVQLGGYMVKAECEGGDSSLYGTVESLPYSDTTSYTNNPTSIEMDQPWSSSSFAIYSTNVSQGATVNLNAGDYGETTYTAPLGYDFVTFAAGILDDVASNTFSVQGLESGSLVGSPIESTGAPSETLLLSNTSPVNQVELKFQQPTNVTNVSFGIAGENYAYLIPVGTPITSGGFFDSETPVLNYVSATGSTEGQNTQVVFNVSFNGNPVSGESFNWFVNDIYTGVTPATITVDSTLKGTVTSDSSGNVTVNYTIPTSYPTSNYAYQAYIINAYQQAGGPWTVYTP